MAFEKNLDKLGKLLSVLDENHLSKEDFTKAIKQILDFLEKVNKKNRDEFATVTKSLAETARTLKSDLDREIGNQRVSLSQAEERSLAALENRLQAIEAMVQSRLSELKDGESPAVEAIVEALKPHIPAPIQGSPDTAEDIRNKLELLDGEERLSVDAISGLEEKIKKSAPSGGGGGAQTLWSLMDVDIVSTAPTNGQTLSYNDTLKRWVPSSAGSGDVTKVGTPVDNQVGVWTGNGTIEGTTTLTFDGNKLTVDNNANSVSTQLDKDVTNANHTTVGLQVDHTSVVTDAGTYTKTGAALQINSNVTETSGTITDSAQVLDINQTHADATGNVVDIANGGAGISLKVAGTVARGNSAHNVSITDIAAAGQNAALAVVDANTGNQWASHYISSARTGTSKTSVSGSALGIEMAGNGVAINTKHDDTGTAPTMNIDRNGNNAGAITGLWVNTANAGAGAAYAAIFEAGKVGVGTTTPAEALGVTGNIGLSGNIELGHASDTTISRVSAGVAAIEGKNIITTDGGTLTGNITLGENTSIDLDPSLSADGKYSGTAITGTSGEALAFGDVVTLADSSGKWFKADVSGAVDADSDARNLLGMCVLAAAGADAATKILLHGVIKADANFPALTVGKPVYVSTTGDITQTQPSTTDHVIRIIGHAVPDATSATAPQSIFFNPDNNWITHT